MTNKEKIVFVKNRHWRIIKVTESVAKFMMKRSEGEILLDHKETKKENQKNYFL